MLPALAVALALIVPSAAAAKAPPRSASHDALRTQCLMFGAEPKNPWALAHGMTGLGKDFVASDGRKAAEVMVSDFLVKSPDPKTAPYGFKRFAADGTPIEPHTNLLTKTLVLSGIPDGTKFKTSFGQVTLADLAKSVEAGFHHVPQSEEYWEDVGWTLDLLAERRSPKSAKFKNAAGKEIDLNEVMEDALAYLELAQKDLGEGLDKKQPVVPKRKQGIYAHSCGGLHLFQGVAHWARHPEVRKRWSKRLDRQLDILFYRLGSEQRQYETALQQAPQYRLQILTQMVKFYGHFLETTGRLRKDLGFKPNAKQKSDLERAKALLDNAVRELQADKAFERMDEIKKSHPQVYLDLIGDSCHAANGLELWR